MKQLIVTIMVLIPFLTVAQIKNDDTQMNYFVAAFNTGYSFKAQKLTAGVGLGYRLHDAYVSANTLIALTSNSTTPKIINLNAGWNFGNIQIFGVASYQTIGGVAEQYFKGTPDEFKNGFRAGGGISYYYPTMPLAITGQRIGQETNVSITLYKAL